jgi:hypothetical protein
MRDYGPGYGVENLLHTINDFFTGEDVKNDFSTQDVQHSGQEQVGEAHSTGGGPGRLRKFIFALHRTATPADINSSFP